MEQEYVWFFYRNQDVAREFPEKNRVHLARILAEMVDKGMLFRIIWDIGCFRRQVSSGSEKDPIVLATR